MESARIDINITIDPFLQASLSNKRSQVFDLAILSRDNSRWSVTMRAQPIKIKSGRTRRLQNAVAAGILALTMSVAGATGDADGQAPGKSQTRLNKTLHWFEVGMASWYGPHFQGKKTANGESYNMNELTCAHRSLPLGSWVRVTNLKNQRTVFVRVNDRGPVMEGRVVDLSFAAAKAVGLAGVGKVKLEPVRGGDPKMAEALMAQLQIPLMPMVGQ
jgi:rare lipoprotein A